MENTSTTSNCTIVHLSRKDVVLLGTAHVSKNSIEEVRKTIEDENPDSICVEIDKTRYTSLTQQSTWQSLSVYDVLEQKKGFLLLANIVLSSFQKRLGVDLGVVPGEEMITAVKTAQEMKIPFSFCDREVHVTLRRAWSKSNLWNKNKLLSALLGSIFTREKLSAEEIEKLKNKNVLIDERDQYLAVNIFKAEGRKVLAVIGAGHIKGIEKWLLEIDQNKKDPDLSEISTIPAKKKISKLLPWIIPALVLGIIAAGFFRSGWNEALKMMWMWILVNGSLSALGSVIALAHPVTVIVAFIAAPLTSLNPMIGVGFVTALIQGIVKKPRVIDFQRLQEDILSLKGFYKNRFTRVLLVLLFSTIGSAIGTFIGIPYLTGLLAG